MRVLKFGGTSVATPQSRKACAKLVRGTRASEPVAVVVSALDGVTDLLDQVAEAAAARNAKLAEKHLGDLRSRHQGFESGVVEELRRVLDGLQALGELTPRSRDLVLGFGERLAAPLLAEEIGPEAQVVSGGDAGIVTDDGWGEANPLREVTRYVIQRRLGPMVEQGKIPVVTGFVGATQHGVPTTLGRGGSDLTATLVGAALGAAEVWLCTDTDGLKAADPEIIPEAATLAGISFVEAMEMVQFGAKGIHPRALEPAVEQGMAVRVVNTSRPEAPGTLIGSGVEAPRGRARSVHLVRDVSLLTVTGAAMVGRRGTAWRVFQAVAEAGANVRMISQSVSESGISVAVDRRELDSVVAALEGSLVRSGYIRGVVVEEEVAIVAIVGEGMRGTPGVAARVFRAVADRGSNVIAIAQGSSELSISFMVSSDRGPDAVRALYREFLA